MEYTVQEDDDAASDKPVPFDVVLCDKAAIWSDMLAKGKG